MFNHENGPAVFSERAGSGALDGFPIRPVTTLISGSRLAVWGMDKGINTFSSQEFPGRAWLSEGMDKEHKYSSMSSCGEGNGNLPSISFLENPPDGGAPVWAAVYGVA